MLMLMFFQHIMDICILNTVTRGVKVFLFRPFCFFKYDKAKHLRR